MKRHELLELLQGANDEEPVNIEIEDLSMLEAKDLPPGVELQPGKKGADQNFWEITGVSLMRGEGTGVVARIAIEQTPKYWGAAVGINEYFELVRAAIEARARSKGDVQVDEIIKEENLIAIYFQIAVNQPRLDRAFELAHRVLSEVLEPAEALVASIEDLYVGAAKRIQGWGMDSLDALVDRMREGTANEKGLTLEELTSRLFSSVPGFVANGRVHTETEEIDIHILNASDDAIWRRESALLLAECKNWSGSVGKDEFVLFQNKLRNRTGRVSCGFLVSWNGFAATVTAEMLRGTQGDLLIVPVAGEELRGAVRDGDFPARLNRLRNDAVLL